MKLFIFSFLSALFINDNGSHHAVRAFSTGAGGCDTGGAVGGIHLNNPTTGSLATGGFQVFLDGATPLQPDTPMSITPSQVYTLSIVPAAGGTFKGALFRVDGAGVTLLPGTNAQIAMACSAVSGVTHTLNDDKTDFKATLQVDGTDITILDVTLVVVNSATSVYYYSQYMLQPAVSTPMAVPVAAPVAEPTMAAAPVAEPTMVEAPVAEPTMAVAPVAEPVAAPMEAPVAVAVPTDVPVDVAEPTGTPVMVMEPTLEPAGEEPMEPNTPGYGNMTDGNSTTPVASPNSTTPVASPNSTTPVASPVRMPTTGNMTAPSPAGPTNSAAMKSFAAGASFLTLVSVVIVAII